MRGLLRLSFHADDIARTLRCCPDLCAFSSPSLPPLPQLNLAPLMAVGVDRRAKKVAAHLDRALLLQPLTTAMSYHPMVQSPASAFPVPETTTCTTAEDPSEYYSQHPDHHQETSPHQQLLKKRRASKDKTSVIRRSSSTPHMRNMALGTTSELSPTGDKRRNKLGYHRTSVACGKKKSSRKLPLPLTCVTQDIAADGRLGVSSTTTNLQDVAPTASA